MNKSTSPIFQDADIEPQIAAQDITNAQALGISADHFSQFRSELTAEAHWMKQSTPDTAHPAVVDYAAQSKPHASLVKPDIAPLDYMANLVSHMGQGIWERPNITFEMSSLLEKKFFDPRNNWTHEDEDNYNMLRYKLNNLPNYGIEGQWETLPGEWGFLLRQMENTAVESAKLTGKAGLYATAVGAVGGALFGASTPIPGGAIGGAVTGAKLIGGTVLSTAFRGSYAYESAKLNTAMIYAELDNLQDSDPENFKADDVFKANLALGLGVTAGIIDATISKAIAKTIPGLNKLFNVKYVGELIANPKNEAIRRVVLGIGESVATSSTGEVMQEITNVLGEEWARKGMDITFDDVVNALAVAQEDGRFTRTALVSSTFAGVASGTAAYPRYRSEMKSIEQTNWKIAQSEINRMSQDKTVVSPDVTEQRMYDTVNTDQKDIDPTVESNPNADNQTPDVNRTQTQRASDAVEFGSLVDRLVTLGRNTNVYKTSKEAYQQILTRFVDNSDLKYVFMDMDEFAQLNLKDEASAEAVRKLFGDVDPDQITPYKQIPLHDFLNAATEAPELIDIMQMDPTLPTRKSAQQFLEMQAEAYDNQQTVLRKLRGDVELGKMTREEAISQVQELLGSTEDTVFANDIAREADFMFTPFMSEEMKSILPAKEYEDVTQAIRQNRQAIYRSREAVWDQGLDKVRDYNTDLVMQEQYDIEYEALSQNEAVLLAEMFSSNTTMFGDNEVALQYTKNHKRKGFSPFAIDPDSLTGTLKRFAKNKQLAKHKVFVKGGMNINDTVQWLGKPDAETLLSQLRDTPTRDELAQRRAERHRAEIERKSADEINFTPDDRLEMMSERTDFYLKEMEFLKDKDWSTTKKIYKRIALPLPRKEEIQSRAFEIVNQMTVGELKPNKFYMGERRANREAINALNGSDLLKAYTAKEKAALNVEIAKQIHIRIGQVNQVFKLAKRLNSSDVIRELKRAGPEYYKAVVEILDLYKLDKSKKGLSEIDSFKKFAEKMAREGETMMLNIPERLADTRMAGHEMPAEAVVLVGNHLRTILHKARNKNKALDKRNRIRNEWINSEAESLANYVRTTNINYKPGRAEAEIAHRKDWKISALVGNYTDSLARAEFLFQDLDGGIGNQTGRMHQAVFQPAVDAQRGKSADIISFEKHLNNLVTNYGKDDFRRLNAKLYDIPEFRNGKGLRGGKLTHADLIVLALQMGNEDNILVVENSTINRHTVFDVLSKRLTERDWDFVQSIWDAAESYKPRIQQLIRNVDGIEPEWVQAKPFRVNGKWRRGGYFRIFHSAESKVDVQMKDLREAAQSGKPITLGDVMETSKYHAQYMTRQAHMEQRVGSNRTVDLNLQNIGKMFEDIIHDLNFREVVIDTAKLVTNPSFTEAVSNTLGAQNHLNLAEWVRAMANAPNDRPMAATTLAKQIAEWSNGAMVTSMLAFNIGTIFAQATSAPIAIARMGKVSGSKYMADALIKIMSNPTKWSEMTAFVTERDPTLRLRFDSMEAGIQSAIEKHFGSNKRGELLNAIDAGNQMIHNFGFLGIQQMDVLVNVVTWQAAFSQAMNGEAKGVTRGDEQAAVNYASSISRTSQTANDIIDRAPWQRDHTTGRLLTNFYSQLSILYNNNRQVINGFLKNDMKEAYQEFAKGNYIKTSKMVALKSADRLMQLYFTAFLPMVLYKMVSGQAPPEGEDEDNWREYLYKTHADPWLYAGSMLAPLPVINNAAYVLEQFTNTGYMREATIGIVAQMNYAVQSALIFAKWYENGEIGEMNNQDKRNLIMAAGLSRVIPSNAAYKYLLKDDAPVTSAVENYYDTAVKDFRAFREKFKDDLPPETLKQYDDLIEVLDPPEPQVMPLPVEPTDMPGSENESASVIQRSEQILEAAPFDTLPVIAQIESGNRWWAKNPKSTAQGLYQFTKGTWDNIMIESGLGLTEAGRVSEDTTEQEMAMKWFTAKHVVALRQAEFEPTLENLYTLHMAGQTTGLQLLKAPADTKLNKIFSERAMEANNWRNSMKVRDFNQFVKRKVTAAREQIDTASQN